METLVSFRGKVPSFFHHCFPRFLGVSLLAGILFGLITMLVQYVGLFMGGLHTGLLLGLGSLLVADHLMDTSPAGSVWLCVGVLLTSALTFAVLNLYFRKGREHTLFKVLSRLLYVSTLFLKFKYFYVRSCTLHLHAVL